MTLPDARVEHALPGRVRFRVPARQGDVGFFEGVRQRLSGAADVARVSTNAQTGSVLVFFEGDLDGIVCFAREHDLFQIGAVTEAPRPRNEEPPPWSNLFDAVQNLDARLRRESDERWGIGPLAFYGLLAACVVQLKRGQYLPAASTLLMQATGILRELSRGRSTPSP